MIKLPLSVKESLLWIYRLHQPKISLDKSTKASINKLQQVAKLVILTDGRSISQRQKIKSLELDHLPVYISEEYQSEHPDLLRFNLIMKDFPSKKYSYVGDNPRKDFIAPNKLNWNTIGLRGDGYNIHSQDSYVTQDASPKFWINNLEELLHIL
jgi:putative hydrolase of the HAD superfamily